MSSIIYLVLTYMIINVISDLKTLKTSNYNHLIFLILGIGISIHQGYCEQCVLAIVGALIFGVLRENINPMKISAGDTKMLIVLSVFMTCLFPGYSGVILAVTLHIVFFFISLLIMVSILLLVKYFSDLKGLELEEKLFEKGKFVVKVYYSDRKLQKYYYSSPESISILMAVLIVIYSIGGI